MRRGWVSVVVPVGLACAVTWALLASTAPRIQSNEIRAADGFGRQDPPNWQVRAWQRMSHWKAELSQRPEWSSLQRIRG